MSDKFLDFAPRPEDIRDDFPFNVQRSDSQAGRERSGRVAGVSLKLGRRGQHLQRRSVAHTYLSRPAEAVLRYYDTGHPGNSMGAAHNHSPLSKLSLSCQVGQGGKHRQATWTSQVGPRAWATRVADPTLHGVPERGSSHKFQVGSEWPQTS